MKIARFSASGADPRFGIVDEGELVVLEGDPMFSGYGTTGERIPLSAVKLLAPVIPRSKVVCIGRNYAAHIEEMNSEVPAAPLLFLKPNTSVIGPADSIVIPPGLGKIEHEAEVAMVVGRIAKQVSAENFADYVFGYTIANDVTARDQQKADGQWARAKGYDTFCPLGPWIETELDTSSLEIQSFVDGEPRRSGNTSDMLHSFAEIFAYASGVWTLLPGDVIITGTPAGLGDFVIGQTVDITVEGIGTLSNPSRGR